MGYFQTQFHPTVIGNGEVFHKMWRHYHTDNNGCRDGKQLEIEVYEGNLDEENLKGKYSAFDIYISEEWIIISHDCEHYTKIKNLGGYILRVKED